jgi:hypothetical protein
VLGPAAVAVAPLLQGSPPKLKDHGTSKVVALPAPLGSVPILPLLHLVCGFCFPLPPERGRERQGFSEPPVPSQAARTLSPEGASFFKLLQQQAEPGAPGFSPLKGSGGGGWANPVRASGFPGFPSVQF